MRGQRIVVLGAGITGLAAGHRVRELAQQRGVEVDLTIVERESRVGGCIETRHDDGFVMELGPDSILAEKPSGVGLVRRLGLEADLVATPSECRGARVVRGRRLVRIPEDFSFFTPTSLTSLVTSGLFSPAGIVRAAMEPMIPARTATGDESLESFVTRRFGREVLDRLAQPLIGGVYSGDPRRLSMRATMPRFLELERTHRSLVLAMRSVRRNGNGATGPRLVSLREGLGSIVASLERRLHDAVRTSSAVAALQHRRYGEEGALWTVRLQDGSAIEADRLICALPAYESARLLSPLDSRLGTLLSSIAYHSVATITMAFDASRLPPLPRCTGFVVPQVEGRGLMAVTFTSQKYPGRAPEGYSLIRAFAGGAFHPHVLDSSDADLIRMARAELHDLLHVDAEPGFSIVRRWPRALPEYALGHVEAVDEIMRETSALAGLQLVGSAYRGAGIPDCVRDGEAAAEAAFPTYSRPLPDAFTSQS
jgi:oxygen-dependent protoporphyrinogen oxidase